METDVLKQNDIQVFTISDELSIFLHTKSLQIYPIKDARLLGFLKSFRANGFTILNISDNKEIYNFICSCINNAPETFEEESHIANVEKFTSIVLPIAGECNLSCPYCFAKTDGGFQFKNFTPEDIDRVVAFVIKKNPSNPSLNIIFFGGEPLMNFDIIKYTISLFKTNYPECKVHYSITTNGTIFNEEIIHFFIENHFTVLLSLDGPDNEFNLRKFKNGRKSIHVVLNNIEKLRIAQIPIQIRATLVSDNPFICETFDFFENLKIPFSIVFAYVSENKLHNLADYNEENLSNIKKQFDELFHYYMDKVTRKENLYNSAFEDIMNLFRFRVKKKISCTAGIEYFTIMSDGTIYSCPHLMNNKYYSIGNIEEGIHDKLMMTPVPVEEILECENCWAKYYCTGGCFSQKISMGKSNRMAKNSGECRLERLLWEFYIKLYYYMKTISPGYFKRT